VTLQVGSEENRNHDGAEHNLTVADLKSVVPAERSLRRASRNAGWNSG
jgi:hypothetical protein